MGALAASGEDYAQFYEKVIGSAVVCLGRFSMKSRSGNSRGVTISAPRRCDQYESTSHGASKNQIVLLLTLLLNPAPWFAY
jgi:hypothetical protein